MKTTFGVLCAILAVHYVAAQCNLKTYTTELKPACDLNDIYIKWPNYANLSTYYTCFGVGNPVLTPCPSGEYFTYVYQQCNYCNQYIPAPPCENLKTQNPPNCVPIGSGGNTGGGNNGSATTASSLPTPYYPTTVVTKPPATKRPPVTKAPPSTKAPVTRPTKSPPSGQPPSVDPTPPSGVPTPPGPPGTPIPGPPSPVTNVPGVPQPPTPEPTPPSINITPPIA